MKTLRPAKWLLVFLTASIGWTTAHASSSQRVISLDYCADQFALGLLPKQHIAALSIDSRRDFSYMREQAKDIDQVRASAENVLALEPTLIIRSYGGGPNAKHFYEQLGIPVVQVGYANSIQQVRSELIRLAEELGQRQEGLALAEEMTNRLNAFSKPTEQKSVMYITQGGVTSGKNTLLDEMIRAARLQNFEQASGWREIPLEELTLDQPEIVATAFYQRGTQHEKFWSAARHPIIRDELTKIQKVELDGATTACGGWFLLDAVENLYRAAYE